MNDKEVINMFDERKCLYSKTCLYRKEKSRDCLKCFHYNNYDELEKAALHNAIEETEMQLQRKEQECERYEWYLKEIRYKELESLDIDWDEYETQCNSTEYSNTVTLVEEALGEREDARY